MALNDPNKLKSAVLWICNNEQSYYGINGREYTRYFSDAVSFVERTRANPDIRWGYQVHTKHMNRGEKTTIHILFLDGEFALQFKLMGF